MPFYYRFLLGLASLVLFSAPAFADGIPGQTVNRGPEPVRAHHPVPPAPGCELINDGTAWACPREVVSTHKPSPHPAPCARQTVQPCGEIKRVHVKTHPPVVTKRVVTHRTAPPQRTITRRSTIETHKVEVSNEVHLDMGSFTGGVGSGVTGGYYGGGGAVVISSGRSYSGVLSHSASSYTFRSHRMGGKRRHGGGGGGCGCMGGGMGGGD